MPDPLQEGLHRQLETLEAKIAGGEVLAGWKVGLTSGQSRDAMGRGFRPFGYVLESRVFDGGASLSLADFTAIGVENEVCFTVGETIRSDGTDVDRDRVARALAGAAPGFEINEPRLPREASASDRLADNLSQWGMVAGRPRPVADIDFEALEVTLSCDGEPLQTVAAAGHIDDHFASIAALAVQLGRFGLALEAGQRVITGAFGRSPVSAPSRWRGDFGTDLGTVEVTFT